MPRFILRIFSIVTIALKRILSQPGLALAALVGMVFAITLSMSVPLYASEVYSRAFTGSLSLSGEAGPNTAYPPLTLLFSYDSNLSGYRQWEDLRAVTDYLKTQSGSVLGLPVRASVWLVATDPLALFPADVKEFRSNETPLIWASIAVMSGLQDHITLYEGEFPQTAAADGPIEVLLHHSLAERLGLQVGEVYNFFARDQSVGGVRQTLVIPARVAGVYRETDAAEDYWILRPSVLYDRVIVSEATFAQRLAPILNNEVYSAFWGVLPDAANLSYDQAASIRRAVMTLANNADNLLAGLRLVVSPLNALAGYMRSATLLTILLYAFSAPIFALLLAFIVMTSSVTVERQKNEIAVLRSRGAMVFQMIGIAAIEGLLLSGAAFVISLPLAALTAWLIGSTHSFLRFSLQPDLAGLTLRWTNGTLLAGAWMIFLALLARLIPTFSAARTTVILYKQERSRALRRPFWQRAWLDVLLLIPSGYGLYLLQRQGSLALLETGRAGDPFQNPLLFIAPILAIFALSLFFLRLTPLLMRLVAWVAARTNSVGLLMAARHLARAPGPYTLPLVLLILTLSLSAFTATLAGTLDRHLHDTAFYHLASEISFLDLGDRPDPAIPGAPAAEATAAEPADETALGWHFMPVSDYLQLPGVQAAARAGRYAGSVVVGERSVSAELLGVDRAAIQNVLFWRDDFAPESLGALMNRLALEPDALLAPRSFLEQYALREGDFIQVRFTAYEQSRDIVFRVAGSFDYFPTYYPAGAPVLIANLDYIFESVGMEMPYHVLLRTDGSVDYQQLEDLSYSSLGANTSAWESPIQVIQTEQVRPERQGLFGVLSVGFSAAALLSVAGFLIYALFSFQRRFIELGVLRAIGLSSAQLTALMAFELAFLILMGGLVGTGLGVWISNQFIPYLQVGLDAPSRVPPYLVRMDWAAVYRIYFLFGLLFVAALTILIAWLRRMKVFQAIKMGETT